MNWWRSGRSNTSGWLQKEPWKPIVTNIPSVGVDLFSQFVGFAMLAIGLLCIFLIGWEFLG